MKALFISYFTKNKTGPGYNLGMDQRKSYKKTKTERCGRGPQTGLFLLYNLIHHPTTLEKKERMWPSFSKGTTLVKAKTERKKKRRERVKGAAAGS